VAAVGVEHSDVSLRYLQAFVNSIQDRCRNPDRLVGALPFSRQCLQDDHAWLGFEQAADGLDIKVPELGDLAGGEVSFDRRWFGRIL
jgi:hypothetical protein